MHIALGWHSRRFQALETQLFEKNADLGGTAFEASEVLDALDGFGNRGGGMLLEVRLDGVMIGLQLAGRAMKLQDFERLNAASLVLLEVGSQGVFTDAHAMGNLVMRQAPRFQQHGFHLPLHAWVGVVIALIV